VMRPNSSDIAGVEWCEIDTSSIGHVETFIWTRIASPDYAVVGGTDSMNSVSILHLPAASRICQLMVGNSAILVPRLLLVRVHLVTVPVYRNDERQLRLCRRAVQTCLLRGMRSEGLS